MGDEFVKREMAQVLPTQEWQQQHHADAVEVTGRGQHFRVKAAFAFDDMLNRGAIDDTQHMAAARLKLFVLKMRRKDVAIARYQGEEGGKVTQLRDAMEEATAARLDAEDLYLKTMRELKRINELSHWIVQYLVAEDMNAMEIKEALARNRTQPHRMRVKGEWVQVSQPVVIGKNRIMNEIRNALDDLKKAHELRRLNEKVAKK